MHLSWGFFPLRHSKASGARIPWSSQPPAPSVLRVWLPSRRVTSPDTVWALFHAHGALGVSTETSDSPEPFSSCRATTLSGFLSKACSVPAMSLGFPTLSSHVLQGRDVAVFEERLDRRRPATRPPGVWFPSASQSMGTTESPSQKGG